MYKYSLVCGVCTVKIWHDINILASLSLLYFFFYLLILNLMNEKLQASKGKTKAGSRACHNSAFNSNFVHLLCTRVTTENGEALHHTDKLRALDDPEISPMVDLHASSSPESRTHVEKYGTNREHWAKTWKKKLGQCKKCRAMIIIRLWLGDVFVVSLVKNTQIKAVFTLRFVDISLWKATKKKVKVHVKTTYFRYFYST